MLLATVQSALFALALVVPGYGPAANDSDEKVVVVDKHVIVEDGDEPIVSLGDGVGPLISLGDGDGPLIIGVGGRRGFIGIRLLELSRDLRKHYGAPEDAGVLVSEVESDTPAAKAGVEVGDVITDIDGDPVDSTWDLTRAVRDKKSGDKVRLNILRDRRPQDVTVTLEEREGRRMDFRGFRSPRARAWSYRVDPEKLKPFVLDDLDALPKLQERLKDLEKRLQELEKRLSAR